MRVTQGTGAAKGTSKERPRFPTQAVTWVAHRRYGTPPICAARGLGPIQTSNQSGTDMRLSMVVIGTLCLSGASADAQQSFMPLGTLTCTTSAPSASTHRDARLSCHFRANSGGDGNYTGHITRQGAADIPPGKRVLIWTVLAQDVASARDLSGAFKGETGGTPTSALIGGQNNSIRLEPVTTTSQIGDQPKATVLSLTLAPRKV